MYEVGCIPLSFNRKVSFEYGIVTTSCAQVYLHAVKRENFDHQFFGPSNFNFRLSSNGQKFNDGKNFLQS